MIGWIERQLKRWGIAPAFDENEMLNAQTDNKLHDFEVVAQEVREETNKRRSTNERLRDILSDAKTRTNSFADMEELVNAKGGRRRE